MVGGPEGEDVVMIRVAITSAAAILLSCPTALATPPYSLSVHPSQDGRCIGDNSVGDLDRSEPACLKQIGEIAQRVGPALQLKFRNGLTRIYLNEEAKCESDEAKSCVKYQLTGYFPKHDLILIEVGYWEGASWLLLRAGTGEASEIVAPPYYSLGESWLVSVASSEGPAGPPNGIDIVPATSDPSLKQWHYRVPDDSQWLYEFDGWDGDGRVKLLATSLGAPSRRVPSSIERRNGTWHLTEPKSPSPHR
jgi:hypothetical protein